MQMDQDIPKEVDPWWMVDYRATSQRRAEADEDAAMLEFARVQRT